MNAYSICGEKDCLFVSPKGSCFEVSTLISLKEHA